MCYSAWPCMINEPLPFSHGRLIWLNESSVSELQLQLAVLARSLTIDFVCRLSTGSNTKSEGDSGLYAFSSVRHRRFTRVDCELSFSRDLAWQRHLRSIQPSGRPARTKHHAI